MIQATRKKKWPEKWLSKSNLTNQFVLFGASQKKKSTIGKKKKIHSNIDQSAGPCYKNSKIRARSRQISSSAMPNSATGNFDLTNWYKCTFKIRRVAMTAQRWIKQNENWARWVHNTKKTHQREREREREITHIHCVSKFLITTTRWREITDRSERKNLSNARESSWLGLRPS